MKDEMLKESMEACSKMRELLGHIEDVLADLNRLGKRVEQSISAMSGTQPVSPTCESKEITTGLYGEAHVKLHKCSEIISGCITRLGDL